MPTAIPLNLVMVGERFGAMYEMLDQSERNPEPGLSRLRILAFMARLLWFLGKS